VDLGVHDADAVVDGGMNKAISDSSLLGLLTPIAAAPGSPPTTVGDRGKLFDINVEKLSGSFPLIPLWRRGGRGAITSIQASHPGPVQDLLYCGNS
jgi:hypothetical protein